MGTLLPSSSSTCSAANMAAGICSSEGYEQPQPQPQVMMRMMMDFFWEYIWPFSSLEWNVLLVSFSTIVNTILLLTIVFFWWANRQFHFRKRPKDGSRLSSVATKQDALDYQRRQRLREKAMIRLQHDHPHPHGDHHPHSNDDDSYSDSSSLTNDHEDEDKEDDDDDDDHNNNVPSWEDFHEEDLSDYDTDSDDEDDNTHNNNTEPGGTMNSTGTSTKPQTAHLRRLQRRGSDFAQEFPPEKRQQVKDLTAVVSQMEVFSYLSQEAFVQCLEYMEYVDLPAGQILFHQDSFDGSLYAVVSGQVQCQFEFIQQQQQQQDTTNTNTNTNTPLYFANREEEEEDPNSTDSFISFTAGNGDVVTSLLSMLAGLVRQCQERTQREYSTIPNNNHNHNTAADNHHVHVVPPPLLPIVPDGISVTAVGITAETRLVRVPPHCFLAMLDRFPNDVYRIAQTIVARMQRVILQTVVGCLGLQKEIVRRTTTTPTTTATTATTTNPLHEHHPDAWARVKDALKTYVPNAAPPTIQEKVSEDTAAVATALIMGHRLQQQQQQQGAPSCSSSSSSSSKKSFGDDVALNSVFEALQAAGSVISLAPGKTLTETGESPDAIYIVLQGSLDVGMHVMGTSSTLKQSQRRTSMMMQNQPSRRSIFPTIHDDAAAAAAANTTPTNSKGRRRSTLKTAQVNNNNNNHNPAQFRRIYQSPTGDMVGLLGCLTGDASIVTIRNSSNWEPALLYQIPKETYQSILSGYPRALTGCLGSILDKLGSPIVCLLDFNVEWMHVQAGEDVIQKGEHCDALYAVLNGRLRAAVAPQLGHFRPPKTSSGASIGSSSGPSPAIPRPEVGIDRNTSAGSFLDRAKVRFKNRVIETMNRNKPKVADAPPPPSRRMMSTTGEEIQGEEFGRGAIIGEVEILTGADWSQDIYASRHSELARVPVNVLNAIIRMCPRAGLHLARVVAAQIQRKANAKKKQQNYGIGPPTTINNSTLGPPLQMIGDNNIKSMPVTPKQASSASATIDKRTMMLSYGLPLATIAVVPLLEGEFDIDDFCQTLQHTLHTSIAPTKLLTKAYARQELGEEVFRQRNAMHSLKMTRLCGDMEENYRLVVYQAEQKYTWWTRFCIQQADRILLVVRPEKAPPEKQVEACLSWAFTALNVKIQLVVLQNSTTTSSTDADEDEDDANLEAQGAYENLASSDELNDWSEQRYWIAGHHAVRTPFRKHMLDFRRLCRRLTGRSIGIVLGGGGARGLAHIGVIKALMEAGITIDFVGGTSQGAYIGALYAINPDDYEQLVKSARKMSASMANNWEKLRDMTLPLVSFFCGHRFNRGIQKTLGLRRIQDLVCNFFCVSVDLRNNVQVVHTKGVCWRYVRASMTLQSYLPPLSEDGTLLVDGGYMNILPADVMKRQMRARTVIAVDVSQEVILDNYEYGTHLNGWWLLYNSWNPFTKTVKIPSMGDISERLAWVNGDRQKKKVREHIDLFLTPPVSNYGVLEYDKFDEIVQLGYEYAKPRVDHFVRKYPHLVS